MLHHFPIAQHDYWHWKFVC